MTVNFYGGGSTQYPVEVTSTFIADHYGTRCSCSGGIRTYPSPASWLWGWGPANVTIPGLCGSLLVGQIVLPNAPEYISVAPLPAIVGLPIYSQGIGFSAVQPGGVAITNLDVNAMPPMPLGPQPVATVDSFTSSTTGRVGANFAVITEFR